MRLALLLILLSPGFGKSQAEAFTPTKDAVSPLGTRAVCDLPPGQHIRNVGGSDGAGLCVFTSVEHSARWQNVRELYGFQDYMKKRPGGGWPQKLDQMIAAFCKSKGVSVPAYIQHTGGDSEFLELALRTGRMPAITYDGRDDFYRGRIAHMVNSAHLSGKEGSIIDNNRPGVFLWMTPPELLSRWRGSDGGWAVVLLASPPPPHLARGHHPAAGLPDRPGEWVPTIDGREFGFWQGAGRDRRCIAYLKASGVCVSVSLDGAITDVEIPPPAALPGPRIAFPRLIPNAPVVPTCPDGRCPVYGQLPAGIPDGGVDSAKVHKSPRYQLNGVEITKDEARRIMAGQLIDDSGRWNLSTVGPAEFRKQVAADVGQLPETVRAKLHHQSYDPADWAVSHFGLAAGVTLRTPTNGTRTGKDVGAIPPAEYTVARLVGLLTAPGGPVAGPDSPVPQPQPVPPVAPQPQPKIEPQPVPAPRQPDPPTGWRDILIAAALLVAAVLLYRKR